MRLKIPRDIFINFAGMAFLGITLFLGWQTSSLSRLASLSGVLYVVIGLLLCGMVIGWPLTRLHRHYCMRLIERQQGDLTPGALQIIRFTGTFVMLLQIVAVYYFAEWSFNNLL